MMSMIFEFTRSTGTFQTGSADGFSFAAWDEAAGGVGVTES